MRNNRRLLLPLLDGCSTPKETNTIMHVQVRPACSGPAGLQYIFGHQQWGQICMENSGTWSVSGKKPAIVAPVIFMSCNPKISDELQRDMAERGHSLESIKASIEARKPDFEAFIGESKSLPKLHCHTLIGIGSSHTNVVDFKTDLWTNANWKDPTNYSN